MFALRTLFKTAIVLGLSMPMAAHADTAARSPQPPASSAMQLAQPTLAPQGFLAFCKRNPEECGVPAPAQVAVAEPEIAAVVSARLDRLDRLDRLAPYGTEVSRTITSAGRTPPLNNWLISDSSWQATNSYLSARSDLFVPMARPQRVVAVDGAVRIDITTAISDLQKGRLSPSAAAPADERGLLQMTPSLWSEIDGVNRQVNRAIVFRSDASNYGASEFWTLPLAEGRNTGDCEDYVLEKRHALIAAGVPMRALSIAVVVTFRGESHAVLLLDTDQGEYVLDSLSNKIQPWTKTGYEWRERQIAGSINGWALVADPKNAPRQRDRTPAVLLASLN